MKLLHHALVLLAVATPVLAVPRAAGTEDDVGTSRERAGLAEEQLHLERKLKRLRQTMQVLASRLEAEGRPRAVELLNSGLELLDSRQESSGSTLSEWMDRSTGAIEDGQLVQSLESQEEIIRGLESLLAILMDRRDLEGIEKEIAELRDLQREAAKLADEERELREETEALRDASANAAQKALESGLVKALEEQRELLRRSEAAGRESGALELEKMLQTLDALRANQEVDREVLRAWSPEEARPLEELAPLVTEARAAESEARRLSGAAEEVREALRQAGEADAEARQEQLSRLERAAEREERDQRVTGSQASRAAAEALRAAAEALRAAEDGDGEARAEELAARADELDAAARERREDASTHRAEALERTRELSDGETAAAELASRLEDALERAQEAAGRARDGSDPRAASEAEAATEEAARILQRGLGDLARLGEALSSSQAAQAAETERLGRSLDASASADSPSAEAAQEALDAAAEAMEEASRAAREEDAARAAEAAAEALDALDEAAASLDEARAEAGERTAAATAELAERQRSLAEESGRLNQLAPQGSMDPASEESVGSSLQEAQAAMERAAEALESARSASAAEAQRQAQAELREALESALSGVQPQTAEDRQRAAELAQRQEEIRERILWLAERAEEREENPARESFQSAAEAAEQAGQSLQSGSLDEAQRDERDVERELEEAREAFEEEEEQYQSLRAEELLFRITEELAGLLETHREQMQLVREIDAGRTPGERPTRLQRLRIRGVGREEGTLGERAGELADAIEAEGSVVFGARLRQIQDDLVQIASDLDEEGGYRTDERVQYLQRDVEESAEWMLEALREEQRRREEEEQQQQEQQGDQGQDQSQENRLVPDEAELKLLRRMEVDVDRGLQQLMLLNPELSSTEPEDVDPLLLRDIQRLAGRHERTSQLFGAFRSRLGLPDPDAPEGEDPHGGTGGPEEPDPTPEEDSE